MTNYPSKLLLAGTLEKENETLRMSGRSGFRGAEKSRKDLPHAHGDAWG